MSELFFTTIGRGLFGH